MRQALPTAVSVACLLTVLYASHGLSMRLDAIETSLETLPDQQRAAMLALEQRVAETVAPTPAPAGYAVADAPATALVLARLETLLSDRPQPSVVADCTALDAQAADGHSSAQAPPADWTIEQAWSIVDEAVAQGSWSEASRDALRRVAGELPAQQFDALMLRLHDAMNTGEIERGEVDLM